MIPAKLFNLKGYIHLFFITLFFLILSYNTTLAAPTITSVSPTSGLSGNDVTIAIDGTDFGPEATVTLQNATDSINLINVIISSSEHISATVPRGAKPGTYDVVVTNPGGSSSTLPNAYNVNGTTTLSSFTPSSGLNGNSVTISIYGSNFKSGITAKLQNTTDTIDLTNVA